MPVSFPPREREFSNLIAAVEEAHQVDYMTLGHLPFAPSLGVLQLILETEIACPTESATTPLMVKAPAVRGKIHSTPPSSRFKQIPQHFFPESVTPVSKKPFEAESPSQKITRLAVSLSLVLGPVTRPFCW